MLHQLCLLHDDIRKESILMLKNESVCTIDFENGDIVTEQDIVLIQREDAEIEAMQLAYQNSSRNEAMIKVSTIQDIKVS